MANQLNELNQRLANAGLPGPLTAATAAQLKENAPRERILQALTRVENNGDNGARTYLDKTLQGIGVTHAWPNPAPDTPPEPAPPQQNVPAPADPSQPPAPPEVPASAANETTPANNPPADTNPRRDRIQHHVYGGKAALTLELDETRQGVPTVALDGATAVAERQYDWANKVRLQFTLSELPVVAAVLLGGLPECNYANHGANNDKGFAVEWQSDRAAFFVKVWQGKGNLRAVPMSREDAFYAVQIVIRAIQQGSPARLDTAGTIAAIRAFYGRK